MIEIVDLKKRFGDTWVSRGVNLTIQDQRMTVIIGRSGEGKSVLLKQLIGLISPTDGHIFIDGTDIVNKSAHEVRQKLHSFGYVFQFAALLDSLNVFENVGITLIEQGEKRNRVLEIVKEKLALVQLSTDILWRHPSELSGGMRKRIGIARTLVANPTTILYDEPTTGLDPITARAIHELMFDMQQKLNITSIVISHDTDIFNYCDVVALLYNGVIQYVGDAKTVWQSDNPYLYQFIRGLSEGPMKA
ncbi:MAG: ATP-binding cassette domain-containing protein [Candidatus Babeliales bacterium]